MRTMDPIWDTIVEIFYQEGVPPSKRKTVNIYVKDLKAMGATPDEIHRRVAVARKTWSKQVTDKSLAHNWNALAPKKKPEQPVANAAAYRPWKAPDWPMPTPEEQERIQAIKLATIELIKKNKPLPERFRKRADVPTHVEPTPEEIERTNQLKAASVAALKVKP